MSARAVEQLQAAALHAIWALPARAKRMLAGAPVVMDDQQLDLDTQLLLRAAGSVMTALTPSEARASFRASTLLVSGAPIPGVEVAPTTVAGAAGPLRARLYTPLELVRERSAPLIVFYHGGGWVAGDLDTHEQPCRLLSIHAGARVLSVDYRLAPEHPFPAQVEDALAAFRDTAARASEFGADASRIAVAGDSAGGQLAAVTCQLAATDGGPAPAFQLLIYPLTDMSRTSDSREAFADGFLLSRESTEWLASQLLSGGGERTDPRVSPLLAEDLSRVAPAMIVTAGFDPLRDEGEAYGERLRQAGVRVLIRRHAGYVHGFANVMIMGTGMREAVCEMGGVVRSALAR